MPSIGKKRWRDSMQASTDSKILFCYNCETKTIFHHQDLHRHSYVESHCANCGWLEWQNRAVEREKDKWSLYNKEQGIGIEIVDIPETGEWERKSV